MKTGILAVSFGTSNVEALENSIVPLEREIAAAFPDAVCYRAFTSGTIRKILKRRTVEGKPDFQNALRELSLQNCRKVHLVPLLLTAGVHTREDMAGEEPVSLRSLLEREGFAVSWSMRGLGEIPAIREMYIRRVKDAYRSLENTKGGLF